MREYNVNLNGKTILVTGAAGFIGGAVCRKLLSDMKSVYIVGLDNLNDYYDIRLKKSRLKEISSYKNFNFIKGDLKDKSLIMSIFDKYHPAVVINLAAQAGVRYSVQNPDSYIESNILGFFNILEGCRYSYNTGTAGVEHLVYASSSSVYGNNKKIPYSTNDKVDNPISLYAATKKAMNY